MSLFLYFNLARYGQRGVRPVKRLQQILLRTTTPVIFPFEIQEAENRPGAPRTHRTAQYGSPGTLLNSHNRFPITIGKQNYVLNRFCKHQNLTGSSPRAQTKRLRARGLDLRDGSFVDGGACY